MVPVLTKLLGEVIVCVPVIVFVDILLELIFPLNILIKSTTTKFEVTLAVLNTPNVAETSRAVILAFAVILFANISKLFGLVKFHMDILYNSRR
jgi:hypothetical protein